MTAADLRAVDELCRLVVRARRLGCRIHVEVTDPVLAELLELAGVRSVLADPELCADAHRDPARRTGGSTYDAHDDR